MTYPSDSEQRSFLPGMPGGGTTGGGLPGGPGIPGGGFPGGPGIPGGGFPGGPGIPGGGFPGGPGIPGGGFPGGPGIPGGGFPGGPGIPGGGFPGGPGGPGGTAPGQVGAPPSGPPSFIPTQSIQAQSVAPGSIRNCLFRYVYIWQSNGEQYWIYLTFVGRDSIAGYRWFGRGPFGFWIYFGLDLRRVNQFFCY